MQVQTATQTYSIHRNDLVKIARLAIEWLEASDKGADSIASEEALIYYLRLVTGKKEK